MILSFLLIGICQEKPKFDFQSQFSKSKMICRIVLLLKNTNLEANSMLLKFQMNIQNLIFLK